MKPKWFYALMMPPLAVLIVTQVITFQQSPLAGEWLYPLLVANVILIVLMLLIITAAAVFFLRKWRRGGGSRLAARLAGLFLAMGLLPATGLYVVSASSVFRGIESWFSTPLGHAFEEGIAFGQHVLGREFERLERDARSMAAAIESGRSLPFWGDDLQLLYRVDDIAIYDQDGRPQVNSLSPLSEPLSAAALKTLRDRRAYRAVSADRRSVESVIPLPSRRSGFALKVSRAIPDNIADGLREIEQGRQAYEKLLILRRGLLYSFMATLTLSFAMVLLVSLWASIRLGARLFRPLNRMATAASAVGRGDFNYRLPASPAGDEIAQLSQAFNAMVDDLELSRRQIGERQAALSKANAYLENLLESLTAGVLTVDGDGCLRQFNGNAEQLLKTPLSPLKGKHFRDWTAAEDIAALVGEFMKGGGDVAEHRRAEGERMLVVRLRRLTSAGGMLVIVDDISRQIKAEREAVWEEASQRFAHEIKNPLTPIRLAAERLENKLGDKLEGEERGMLSRLSSTIINQVEAMREMVDAFRLYASEKSGRSERMDLGAMAAELAGLYERPGLTIHRRLAENIPPIRGDAVALRQALHNILSNAVDAAAGAKAPQLWLCAEPESGGGAVLSVEDNGGGVPEEMLAEAFKPYRTGKKKGTGLGLSIAQKIMKDHGGSLTLENTPEGARASLRFPPSPSD